MRDFRHHAEEAESVNCDDGITSDKPRSGWQWLAVQETECNNMTRDFDPKTEAVLLRAFVVSQKQERLIELLSNPRRRARVLASLAHFRDLDERFKIEIPHAQQTASGIAARLFKLGAPRECYAISENPAVDGRLLELERLLETVVGMGSGTLISCIPGRLGYYEGESPNNRWILTREAA